MLTKTYSAAVIGVDAYTIEVEVNANDSGQERHVSIVGLPDTAVKESKDRVISAIFSSGHCFPYGYTVIGLAPADIKKEGAAFDLPIALSVLATGNLIQPETLAGVMLLGELALNGAVRPIKGALPVGLHASSLPNIKALIVPQANAEEAAIAADGLPVYGVDSLADAVDLLTGNPQQKRPININIDDYFHIHQHNQTADFGNVKGQQYAKRAMEIAAAGGHNALMIGPPGSGKSLISKCLSGILPPMSLAEALETTKIHSIMGTLPGNTPLIVQRPFRAPHHTISDAGLIGGGRNTPKPGEISLAHNGILFLDELPEFKRNVLEVLRQPLENGEVTISRASGSFNYPSRFVLIAAMNPCPCGYYGSRQRECRCNYMQIQKYRNRLSGPLLDRIDIHIEVGALSENELLSAPSGEKSSTIRQRVTTARCLQEQRFNDISIHCNSQMQPGQLQAYCNLDKAGRHELRHAIRDYQLSARAHDRILRVARTIADLNGKEEIAVDHIYEAIQYRCLDQTMW